MRLRINGFENEVIFTDDSVNILEINNTNCYTHIIKIINDKINGIESNEVFLLDENNDELKMDKHIYLVIDVFNIEYNSRKIMNKIYDLIAINVKNNQDFKIEEMALKLRNCIIEEINEMPFEFEMKNEIDIPEILKLYNLKIDNDNYSTVLQKIEILIDILATLKIADLLIIPNLKMFLNDEELLELYKYSLYNNINLLAIERKNDNKLKYESILRIDDEFYDRIE